MTNGDAKQSCVTCTYLKDCQEVSIRHIEQGLRCGLWRPAEATELEARRDIQKDFGLWVLRYAVPHLVPKHPKRKRRTHG